MDVKIIGAGPGGLLTGLYLLEKGITPKIFEKQSKENYESTPCAEGISQGAIDKLKQDIRFDSSSLINNKPDRAILFFPSGKKTFLEEPVPVILNRTDWLRALGEEFEKRGGEIEYEREVKNPENLKYDYLIGADGPVSKVRGLMNGEVKVTTGCQYRFEPENYEDGVLELYWNKKFSDFYSWIFPKKDYLTIGCGGKIENLDRFLESKDMEGKILEREIHPITYNGTKFQENNIFLIGDAAGMLNPVLGDGLGPIISASEILSTCIHEEKPKEYEKGLKEKLPDPKVTNVLLSLNQSDLKKLGGLLDGVNFLDFIRTLLGGENLLDVVREDMIFEMFKSNFFNILRDPNFLAKLLRIYKSREKIKRSLKLWSKRV